MINDGDGLRELSGLVVPRGGSLEATGDLFEPYRLLDVPNTEISLRAMVLGGAGDENRTRVVSLENWGSTIELRPRATPLSKRWTCKRWALRSVSLVPAVLRFESGPAPGGPDGYDAGHRRAVAQLGSALRLGRRCRRFKSCQPDRPIVRGPARGRAPSVFFLGGARGAGGVGGEG